MDGRKNNGGNSTKSLGVDKRKNQYLELLEQASTPDEIVSVIQKLKSIALVKGDVQAIKLYLEYYLGKPKETIETTHNLNNFDIKDLFKFDNNKE
jgi:hypothetical protein